MPPFFVLLLDPANTGGLARRCCTSILSLHNFYELYYSTFEKSELGRIKKLLPLREMERASFIEKLSFNAFN